MYKTLVNTLVNGNI